MDKPSEQLPCNMLTAKELLRNKGISNDILEEWEKSLKTLPKSGKKHFEPDNSWLQNAQIEKGLKNRRDLLNIERVERISELASAEWLSSQKRALVTKKSGQDWNNFGLEKNGFLYLLPEEALFLIETNCLELIWNGVSCSIQQAYEILIDDSMCTLEEYRVYSQLTRYGYRIQRYIYEDSDKNRLDELTPVKRKIIVDPENGLRMSDSQQNKQSEEKSKSNLVIDTPETRNKMNCDINITKEHDEKTTSVQDSIKQIVYNVVDQLLCNVESYENANKLASHREIEIDMTTNGEEKSRSSKPEIISNETVLCNIKILKDTPCKASKWPGTRIQRNVKQLPKRNDKVSPPEVSIIDSSSADESSKHAGKRKTLAKIDDSHTKKSKHEVIELSDDEIQELPRCMTRMEMLNLLPNIAFQSEIKEKVSRRYIPHNIRPQKNIYQYNRTMILNMQENDKKARQNCKNNRTNGRQSATHSRSPLAINNRSILFQNHRSFSRNPSRSFYSMDQMHGANISLPYVYRFPFSYLPDIYLQNRITQNVFHNSFVAFGNHGNTVQQRSLTIQMNNFMMPIIEGYRTRQFFPENQFRHSFYQNTLLYQRFNQRRTAENALTQGNVHSVVRRRHDETNNLTSHEIVNRPSFTTRLGASSWVELKRKWSEEKTITIDDEDCKNKSESEEECSEIQIVKLINPLVGPKNASSLAEIFNRLAIIKSAPERIVRRKKNKYKISYNVYSCAHHYRKTNPGQPLYSLVVVRKEDPILQPVEFNRLQQDAKGTQLVFAYVSMSISYIQPDIITMPNII